MSEAQKYEGAMYKEKPAANGRVGKNNNKQHSKTNGASQNNNSQQQQQTPVKETPRTVSFADDAPTPPVPGAMPSSTVGEKEVNVFDYLVNENTPNSSKEKADHASPLLGRRADDEKDKGYDSSYEKNGFSYGEGPIKGSLKTTTSKPSMEFKTPAPKEKKGHSREDTKQSQDKHQKNDLPSDKKRKRQVEDVDLSGADSPDEAPSSTKNNVGTPTLQHSGLTGGLDRMFRDEDDKAARAYRDGSSPIKRTSRGEKEARKDHRELKKSRAERLVSSMFGVPAGSRYDVTSKGVVRSSRKSRHQQQVGSRRDSDDLSSKNSTVQNFGQQGLQNDELVQYQMAGQFLSLITKGPDSTRGMSVHKVLKRLHGQYEHGPDDESDMWRALRTRRNDRGEIVLFI